MFKRVLYEGREQLLDGCSIIKETYYGNSASISSNSLTGTRTFITYRRSNDYACNTLAAIDICVIIKSKGEQAPHSFNEIQKNLNNGLLGASVFVCYKKALIPAKHIKYQPELLSRYPLNDYDDLAFPDQVANFGLPMGAMIEIWPNSLIHKQKLVDFSTFVLNISNEAKLQEVKKVYCSCVIFYEKYDINKLNEEQLKELNYDSKETSIYSNKCILLLSRYPFFDAFNKFLMFLYKQTHLNESCKMPIERYISHFIHLTSFPTIQKPHILIHLNRDNDLSIYLHEETILPQSGASFIELLRNLGSDNCIQILIFTLLQKNLMVHSLRPSVLTGVVEAISCIIFPFIWKYNYIPMCPLNMYNMIDAPVSFIYGMDSRYFDIFETPKNVICIDLDTNRIAFTDDCKNLTLKILPKRAVNILKNRLNTLREEISSYQLLKKQQIDEFKLKKYERHLELSIREAYLRFMVSILHNYKQYLRTGTRRPDTKALDRNLNTYFDCNGFIQSKESSYSAYFYQELTRTQLFYDFIMNVSFISELEPSLADSLEFFDDCCNKFNTTNIDRDESIRLLDINTNLSDQTIVVLPPEENNDMEWKYDKFPELDSSLFEVTSIASNNQNTLKPLKLLSVKNSPKTPNTPHIGLRTKAEKIQSQKKLINKFTKIEDLKKQSEEWAFCLLSNAYSLWFIYLPALIESNQETKIINTLNYAYKVLIRMQKQLLKQPDEICYRVLMQLCLVYKLPTVAVKVLLHMRKYKIEINHITYSYYNKCIIEGNWPSFEQDKWGKLRTMLNTIKIFKFNLKLRKQRLAYERKLALSEARKQQQQGKFKSNKPAIKLNQSSISSQSCSLSSIIEPDKISRDDSIDSGAYLDSDLNTKLNLTRTKEELALIKKNTLKFDLKIKSKTMIVRKSLKLNRDLYSDLININEIGDVCVNGHDQLNLFDCMTKNESQVEFKLRKYRSWDDIFYKYQIKSLKNLNKIKEIKNKPVIKQTKSKVDIVVVDPLGAYLKEDNSEMGTTNGTDNKSNKIDELFDYKPFNLEPEQAKLQECNCNLEDENNDSDDYSSTDDEDTEETEEEEDNDEDDYSLNNSRSSIKPLTGALFSFVGKVKNSLEQNTKLKDVTQFTSNKLTELKNKLPVSLSQQEITHKIRSISAYTINNASGLLQGSKQNLNLTPKLNESNKSSESINSHLSQDDIEMPDAYDAPEDLFDLFKLTDNTNDLLMSIDISSCNYCLLCSNYLYDEEIMSQWSPNDSDLSIKCIYCKQLQVPQLFIRIKDNLLNEFNVPYLSPLVVRKELENIFSQNELNSQQLFVDTSFIDKHNVVFWNLMWYFNRLDVDSELSILLLNNKLNKKHNNNDAIVNYYNQNDKNRVRIICYWDELTCRDDYSEPIYKYWQKLSK